MAHITSQKRIDMAANENKNYFSGGLSSQNASNFQNYKQTSKNHEKSLKRNNQTLDPHMIPQSKMMVSQRDSNPLSNTLQ
jgi:hypothetical protein